MKIHVVGVIGLWCLYGGVPIHAEEPSKSSKPQASVYLSIVAIGPKPRRRFKMPEAKDIKTIQDASNDGAADREPVDLSDHAGIPIPLPPLLDSVPPASLYVKLSAAIDGEENWLRLRVGFNSSTSVSPIPADAPLILYQRIKTGGVRYENYLKLPDVLPGSQMIAFLVPNTKGRRLWSKEPKVSLLNLHSKALNHKNLLVRNFSHQPVAFIVDGEKPRVLAPSQRKSLKLVQRKGYHRIAAVMGVKNQIPLMDTSIRVPEKTLTVIVFYDANPKTNAGKSVGVFRTTVSRIPPEVLNQVSAPPKP